MHLYSAMLCVSASLLSPGVFPSICLSVGVLYPDGWRYRQTYFSAW